MTDIAAALTVLQTHLVAAGAAVTDDMNDVARGLPTGDKQIRYYWAGEVDPPRMGGRRVLNGDLVGVRFVIVAVWPLTSLDITNVASIDAEMQTLAREVRTRIDADSQLGGNVTDLALGYGEPDLVTITGTRCIALRWELDLSYLEYPVAV